jgi:hypothetical protein
MPASTAPARQSMAWRDLVGKTLRMLFVTIVPFTVEQGM